MMEYITSSNEKIYFKDREYLVCLMYNSSSNKKKFELNKKKFLLTKFLEIINPNLAIENSRLEYKGNLHQFIFYIFFEVDFSVKTNDTVNFYILEKKLMKYIQLFLLNYKLQGSSYNLDLFTFPRFLRHCKNDDKLFQNLDFEIILNKYLKKLKKNIQFIIQDNDDDSSLLITPNKYNFIEKFLPKTQKKEFLFNFSSLLNFFMKNQNFVIHLKKFNNNNNFYSIKTSCHFIFIWLKAFSTLCTSKQRYHELNDVIIYLNKFTLFSINWDWTNAQAYKDVNRINSFLLKMLDELSFVILNIIILTARLNYFLWLWYCHVFQNVYEKF